MASNRPTFPGLYRPRFELDPSVLLPIQPNGQYLQNAGGLSSYTPIVMPTDGALDIYVFTLYWTFIFYTPLFVITGACAALLLALKPLRGIHALPTTTNVKNNGKLTNALPKRAIVYGGVVFLVYIIVGTGLAVIGSTVVGFLIAGVYEAGRFQVSTYVNKPFTLKDCSHDSALCFIVLRWVPFVWALLQTLVALTRFALSCPSLSLYSQPFASMCSLIVELI
jgi:hypothetical protein